MDNSTEPKPGVDRDLGFRPSDPARLCCALTRLSQALATCVPQTEMRIALTRGVSVRHACGHGNGFFDL